MKVGMVLKVRFGIKWLQISLDRALCAGNPIPVPEELEPLAHGPYEEVYA